MTTKRKWYWRNRGLLYKALITPLSPQTQALMATVQMWERELNDMKKGPQEKMRKDHNKIAQILELNRKISTGKGILSAQLKNRKVRSSGWKGLKRIGYSAPAYLRLQRRRSYARAKEWLNELDILTTLSRRGEFLSNKEHNRIDTLRKQRERLEKIVKNAGVQATPTSEAKKK